MFGGSCGYGNGFGCSWGFGQAILVMVVVTAADMFASAVENFVKLHQGFDHALLRFWFRFRCGFRFWFCPGLGHASLLMMLIVPSQGPCEEAQRCYFCGLMSSPSFVKLEQLRCREIFRRWFQGVASNCERVCCIDL